MTATEAIRYFQQAGIKPSIHYVEAKKQFDGFCLYFRGTRNEVLPASVRFASAGAARSFLKVVLSQLN